MSFLVLPFLATAAAQTPVSFLVLPFLATAAAQAVWGTTGEWESLQASIVNPQDTPNLAYRGATHAAGSVIFTTNDLTNPGGLGVSMYDVANRRWQTWDGVPIPINDPFPFEVGGQVFVLDESNITQLAFVDASDARAQVGPVWSTPVIGDGPAPSRYGMRFVAWGSLVYFFGGVDQGSAVTAHSDMWALSSGVVLTGQPFAGWTQVAQDGTLPISARSGYTWATFGTFVLLFGGVSLQPTAPPGTPLEACFDPASARQLCAFSSEVWQFTPGNPGPVGSLAVTPGQWALLGGGGAPTGAGPSPSGRFDMVTGVISDQMYVYGGTTATGASTEMWAYNAITQVWGLVTPSLPAPDAAALNDVGYGVGTWLGRHFYRFRQSVSASGDPLPGTGQLWRWAPSATGSAAAAAPTCPAPAAISAAAYTAHSWGLAIGILVGVFNTYLLVLVVRNSALDVLALCKGAAALVGLGSSSAPQPSAGYYSSVSAGKGEYVAPA